MTVERIDKNRPVVYKDHKITIEKINHRYVYKIHKTFEAELSGVAYSLDDAFKEARSMIDKMEDS